MDEATTHAMQYQALTEAMGYTAGPAELAPEEHAAAMRKDAERYRWLRDRLLGADFNWGESGVEALAFEMPAGFSACADADETIDEAMAHDPAVGAA
jgi:hypothetical protein